MRKITRRAALKASVVGAAFGIPSVAMTFDGAILRKGHIHQSVCRWCYQKIPLDQLAEYAARIGLRGVDLLQPDEYEIPRRYGLLCTMGYAGGGEIGKALNRVDNHATIEQAFRTNIPRAAKAGMPNVIAFSGNRGGMSDEEGARNTIAGLNRVKKIAEDHGVTICMELLNSKRDHPDYMCDHTAWGVRVIEEVNSPNVKLLYDIYHMQIMEGDLIETIRRNIQWIGHFHTGGVPGRHELDRTQEVQWDAVMRAIVGTDYGGYVAHEFVPSGDPLASLGKAADLCDV
ncbi:MAG TPA: TIM barrel protein [Candidatus Sulfotelmatobacter sp.]|jgi:hydroxypyruvate isomerase